MGTSKKTSTENKPYVENYPPLKEWLDKHDARCQWQLPHGPDKNPSAYVECWLVKKGAVIVIVHANKLGWSIFTELPSNVVLDVLADADARIGAS